MLRSVAQLLHQIKGTLHLLDQVRHILMVTSLGLNMRPEAELEGSPAQVSAINLPKPLHRRERQDDLSVVHLKSLSERETA